MSLWHRDVSDVRTVDHSSLYHPRGSNRPQGNLFTNDLDAQNRIIGCRDQTLPPLCAASAFRRPSCNWLPLPMLTTSYQANWSEAKQFGNNGFSNLRSSGSQSEEPFEEQGTAFRFLPEGVGTIFYSRWLSRFILHDFEATYPAASIRDSNSSMPWESAPKKKKKRFHALHDQNWVHARPYQNNIQIKFRFFPGALNNASLGPISFNYYTNGSADNKLFAKNGIRMYLNGIFGYKMHFDLWGMNYNREGII